MGCTCLLAVSAAFFPRLALLYLWLFTPLVARAFQAAFLLPLLGIIFLPYATLFYVFAFVPGVGLPGWGWGWVILGVLLDLSSYASNAYANRHRLPGYSQVDKRL